MQNTKFQTYRNYIALDWSKDIAAVASMRDSASSPVKKHLPADIRSLKAYLKSFKGSKILAIEETSTSHWLYVELFEWVDKILVCDPYRNHLLKEGPKTDKLDAEKLCILLRNNSLKEVYHTMDKAYEIRKLVSVYQDFVNASTRLKNQRSAIFRSEGKSAKEKECLNDSRIKEFITRKQVLTLEHHAEVKKEFEAMFKEIRKKNDIVKLLTSITGIADINAVKLYSVVIDASRFETKYKYWAYCGLVKHLRQSGNVRYGMKTTRHNKTLKSVYRTAEIITLNGTNDIRQFYEFLLQSGIGIVNAKNAIARYIATSTLAMMKHKTEYRPYQWRETKN